MPKNVPKNVPKYFKSIVQKKMTLSNNHKLKLQTRNTVMYFFVLLSFPSNDKIASLRDEALQ